MAFIMYIDASKGPMSGIMRLFDSARVIEKISESERPAKPAQVTVPTVVQKVVVPTPAAPAPWRTTSRQLSEDDEIAKQKRMNKLADQEKTTSSAAARRQTSNEPSEAVTQTSAQETPSSRVRKLSPDRLHPKKRSESEDSGSSNESATSSSVGTGKFLYFLFYIPNKSFLAFYA